MPITKDLLQEFDEEFGLTRRFLALVPSEAWNWKPHTKSMELGRLAWHLAEFPEWCLATCSRDSYHPGQEEAEKAEHGWEGKNRGQALERFDTLLPQARASVGRVSESGWARHWTMVWAGQTVIDEPREDAYAKYTIHHMVHHRAQLGLYLRMLGVAIPGCYGPSADEVEAMTTAA